MKLSKLAFSALLIGTIFTSCESVDDVTPPAPPEPLGAYENGIIVNGEGGFGNGNASIRFISNDLAIKEDLIFTNVNSRPLGDTSQSITFTEELAYIVVNNSNKVEVVNRYTFESIATIDSGFQNPRFMAISGNKGYVTNWGDGMDTTDDFIAVISLDLNEVESTIPVVEGPEQIISNNGKLYVSHEGGFNVNNKISVINSIDNSVSTVIVNDKPDDMIIDNSGNLVVLCSGENSTWQMPPIETQASITKIDLADNSIIANLLFPEGDHPGFMAYENGIIHYTLNNQLYNLQDSDTALPTSSVLNIELTSADPSLYGMTVKDDRLYVSDASFSGISELLIYDLNLGIKINTLEAPIGVSKVYFN